jgi:hypothetical protein
MCIGAVSTPTNARARGQRGELLQRQRAGQVDDPRARRRVGQRENRVDERALALVGRAGDHDAVARSSDPREELGR